MNTITDLFHQETTLFGYPVNLGQAIATASTIALVSAFAIKKLCKSYTQQRQDAELKRKVESLDQVWEQIEKRVSKAQVWEQIGKRLPKAERDVKRSKEASSKTEALSEERFWSKVEEASTKLNEEAPVVIQGKTLFPSLKEARREMALNCSKHSAYVATYFMEAQDKRTVLDLGCGLGVNSLPLLQKGWEVTAIDKLPEAINLYNLKFLCLFASNKPPLTKPTVVMDDIVTCAYPENVDAVICVDVLHYIPPMHLKNTLKKIFQAVRPGGQFIGTLFFLPSELRDRSQVSGVLVEFLTKLGAHFYPGKEFTREIITRSGFKIVADRERDDGGQTPPCLEFLAEKPA